MQAGSESSKRCEEQRGSGVWQRRDEGDGVRGVGQAVKDTKGRSA